jgi:hypothetical protein
LLRASTPVEHDLAQLVGEDHLHVDSDWDGVPKLTPVGDVHAAGDHALQTPVRDDPVRAIGVAVNARDLEAQSAWISAFATTRCSARDRIRAMGTSELLVGRRSVAVEHHAAGD